MAGQNLLADFYTGLENGYYSAMDWLQEKGVPVYGVIDAIEGANMPSFPIAIILVLLALYGIFLLAGGALGGSALTVTVLDADNSPVQGAAVSASLDGKILDSQATDSKGMALLKIPQNSNVQLKASRQGYKDSASDFLAQRGEETKTIVLGPEVAMITKTITFMQAGTSRLLDEPITVEFSCSGNSFYETKTVQGGMIDLELESDCDTLSARPGVGYGIPDSTVSFASDGAFSFDVEKAPQGKGGAIVTVSDSGGSTVAGVDATLWTVTQDNVQGASFETKQTAASGSAVFNGVPSGRYYIVAYDRSGTFSEFDGLKAGAVQDIRQNETTSFAVVLGKNVAGKIKAIVKDRATGDAVAGAAVKLLKGQSEITSQQTNGEGRVELSVGEDITYTITVDKAGYLLGSVQARPSADFTQIEIEQATAENSESLLVTVVDESGRPIENVRMRLKLNSDGSQVGAEIVTGLDGRGLFERVGGDTYYVYAVKPGYGEKTSDPVVVSNRQQNVLKLKIPIGSGKLHASVIDEQGKAVAGASLKIVDSRSFQALQDATSDSDGKREFTLRADKSAFIVVSANGYVATTTVPAQMQKDVAVEKQVVLVKAVQAFAVEPAGIYLGDESVSDSDGALSAGQKYTARFRVMVPKGASLDEAGLHIRTGGEQAGSLDKDALYITEVRAAYNALVESTTYSPPTGQATDLQHQTSGSAKWANIVFKKATGGVYEAEVDVQVREEAKVGTLLEIWYRGWARSGGYLRAPGDAVLGTSDSVPQKQGLYANALKLNYSIGPSSLCGDDFCARYLIEDLREGLTSSVIDSYSGQVSGKYRLMFEISGKSKSPFGASQLLIRDKTSSIAIASYKVRTALGEERTGTNSASQVSVAVGDISGNSVVGGEIVFDARKEGTVPVELSIVSGSGSASVVYSKTIYVKILPARKMNIDIVPKILVPLVNNNILVHVTDGDDAVSNAKIGVKKDGEAIASGETDIDGVFAYALSSPSEGSRIGFAAEKQGYAPTEIETKVTGNILSSDPKTIKFTVNIGGKDFRNFSAMLLNYSQVPLEIEKISAGKEFNGYANFSFDSQLEGTVLEPDSNAPLTGTLTLGNRGSSITRPTKVLGAISILVSNANFRQKWLASIPLELGIGFGDEVDDTECFAAGPTEWKIVGGTKETKRLVVSIGNTCSVNGEAVNLRNLSARIVPGSDQVPGRVQASASLEGAKQTELGTTFRAIADTFVQGEDGTVTLTFLPEDVSGASSKSKIELQATHLTSTGSQKMTRKIDVTVSLSDIAQCLQILPEKELTVQSCPYNTGYGNYGSRFSQYGNSQYSQYDPYASRYGYGNGMPPYLGSSIGNNVIGDSYYDYRGAGAYYNTSYPNSRYGSPYFPSEGINSSNNSSWGCGGGSITVKNTCPSPIEITFEPAAGVNVKEKSVKIAPESQANVGIEPTNFFGRYAVGVQARISESGQKPVGVKTVYVNVTNEWAKNYRDCISISPSGTLDFSSFLPRPITLSVINTCYDQGVVLDGSNQTIQFLNSYIGNPASPIGPGLGTGYNQIGSPYGPGLGAGYSPYGSPHGPGFGLGYNTPAVSGLPATGAPGYGSGYGSGYGLDTPLNMVQSWAFKDEVITPVANGKVKQIVYFEVVKNFPAYQGRAPTVDFFNSNIYADIGNMRYTLARGYYTVSGRTMILVRFSTPGGGYRETTFPVTIMDYWALLQSVEGIAKQIRTYGDPGITPEKCVKDEALDFSELGPRLVNGSYSTAENPKGPLFKISDQGGCGSTDKIQLDTTEFTDRSGLKVKLATDGHEITVSFDDSAKKWNGGQADIQKEISGRITRVSPARTVLHNFKLHIKVAAKEGQGGGGGGGGSLVGLPYDYACKDTGQPDAPRTGLAAYQDYGFQHFSFDWRDTGKEESGVQKDSCDSYDAKLDRAKSLKTDAPWFCDATQATIALSKKLEEIRKVTSAINGDGACNKPATNGFECAGEKKASELFRYALPQDAQGRFLAADKKALNLADALGADVKDITDTIASLKNQAERGAQDESKGGDAASVNAAIRRNGKIIITKLKQILQNDKYRGTDVLLEYNYGNSLQYIDASDYQAKKDECAATPANCKFAANADDNLKVLQSMANGTWKLVAYNRADLGQEMKKLIMQNAKWEIGKTPELAAKYANFYEFYRADINASMLLISDKYNDEFIRIANSEKLPLVKSRLGDAKLSFSGAEKEKAIEAGEYNVTVDYAWETKAAQVKLALGRPLAKIDSENKTTYAKNPLFSMPIDAPLDWGTGFSGTSGDSQMYFNYYDTAVITNNPVTSAKSASGAAFSYGDKYADTKDGRMLTLSKDNIRFSPSVPAKVDALVHKSGNNPAGFLLSFKTKSGSVSGTAPLDDRAWYVTSAGLGTAEGSAVKAQVSKADALCGPGQSTGNQNDYYGIVFSSSAQGSQAELSTLIYPPLAGQSSIVRECMQDTSTKLGVKFPSTNEAGGTLSYSGSNSLVVSGGSQESLFKDFTLKKILDLVKSPQKSGKACVKPAADGSGRIEFYWNDAQLLGVNP